MVGEEDLWPARQNSEPSRPPSINHWLVSVAGLIAVVGSLVFLRNADVFDTIVQSVLFVCGVIAAATLAMGWLTQKHPPAEAARNPDGPRLPRCLVKLVGFCATLAVLAVPYLTFPEYAGDAFGHYWEALRLLGLPVAVLALPYIYLTDRRMADPRDGYWAMGMLVLGQFGKVEYGRLWQHMLGWLVKGYFLPLMFVFACEGLNDFLNSDLSRLNSFKDIYDWTINGLYLLDVLVATTGYIMSLRLFDTHIRSTEPTPLGWVSALVCYMPFYGLVGSLYTKYDTGKDWTEWLKGSPALFDLWGCAILFLIAIYAWSTLAFGCRFSNLTHRGIITNGPYRWTKHPAYVAKNLSWWMVFLPSLATDLRASACLLALNFIYLLRARTEERHLSLDPVYREYAAWIDRHGIFRRFPRVLPRLLMPLCPTTAELSPGPGKQVNMGGAWDV